jgi:ABC-2 type transport system permease protein
MFRTINQFTKTAAMEATGTVGDNPLFLLQYLFRFLRVVVLLSVWQLAYSGKGVVSGLSVGAVLTYALVAEVFADQLTTRTELWVSLRDGSIAVSFLQPFGLVGQFTARMVGRWLFSLAFFSLPLLLVSPLLGVDPRPASPAAGVAFVASLLLAITVGVALEFIFGAMLGYFEQSVYAIDSMRAALTLIVSGALIPLQLMPWGLGEVLQWLPFASVASAPLRIYTGAGDVVPLLALQLAWALVLWPFARWLWNRNRERLVAFGG